MTRTKAPPVDVRQVLNRSFAIDPTKQYLVHNRTPKRIEIADRAYGLVTLAPLAGASSAVSGWRRFVSDATASPNSGALDQKPSASRPDPPSAAAPAAGRSR